MQPDELLCILHTAEKLKDTTRHCCTSGGRRESVAEQRLYKWVSLELFFAACGRKTLRGFLTRYGFYKL